MTLISLFINLGIYSLFLKSCRDLEHQKVAVFSLLTKNVFGVMASPESCLSRIQPK